MIKKLKLVFIVSTLVFFSGIANSAQKDCSVFKHTFDRNICEAQNAESQNSGTTTSSASNAGEKTTGFFKKIGSKLKLKKHKKFRDQGDQ